MMRLSTGVFLVMLMLGSNFSAQAQIYEGQFAPPFIVKDVDGRFHSVDTYKGQKVLISFYKSVSDGVSAARFAEIEEERDFFVKHNVVALAVFNSTPENVKAFRTGKNPYQIFISDSAAKFFDVFQIGTERRALSARIHGAGKRAKKGKKEVPETVRTERTANRAAATFLLDEGGNVSLVHYARYAGDDFPVQKLEDLLK